MVREDLRLEISDPRIGHFRTIPILFSDKNSPQAGQQFDVVGISLNSGPEDLYSLNQIPLCRIKRGQYQNGIRIMRFALKNFLHGLDGTRQIALHGRHSRQKGVG